MAHGEMCGAHVAVCLQAMSAGQQQPALQLPQPSASAAPVMLPEGLDLSNLGALAAMLGVGSVSATPAVSGPGGALVTGAASGDLHMSSI